MEPVFHVVTVGSPPTERQGASPRLLRAGLRRVGVANVPKPDAALRDPLRGRDGGPRQGLAAAGLGDRRRVHVRPGAGPLPGGRAEGRGQQRLLRPRLPARAGGQGAARVRRAGPQPGEVGAHRRRLDGLRRRLRTAVRPGRRRAPRRDDGRLPQLHPPRAVLRRDGLRGRRDLRAQRRAARLAAPRHDLRAADADRQDLHGQRRLRPERGRHDRDELDPLRRPRQDRADAGHDLADQLQLAAALGRPDARRAVRVLRGQPAGRHHAVPADGRHVAGLDPGDADPADGRGADRNRSLAADPARAAR